MPDHRRTSRDSEEGATAVEYGLLVGGIAAVVVLLVMAIGGLVEGSLQHTCSTVKSNGQASHSTC